MLKRLGSIFLISCLFLCCLYAIHDMQTAEGIGLYFSLQAGIENRSYMDLLVDVCSIAGLAVLIYVPCHLRRVRTWKAFARLLIVYLAVIPQLSLTKILQLFQRREAVFLWEQDPFASLWEWIYQILPFLQIWLPVLLVVAALAKANQCFCFARRHKVSAWVMALLLLLGLCIPTERDLALYVCGYLGVLWAFDWWEALFEKNAQLEKWSYLPLALLLLRGIYRMIALTSRF